jgi:hypothetical protein
MKRTMVPITGQPSRAPFKNTQWYRPAAVIMSAVDAKTAQTASFVPLR